MTRLERARRILRAQQQMQSIAELEDRKLSTELLTLETARMDIINALNGDDKLQGLFMRAAAQALRKTSEQISGIEKSREITTATLREKSRNKKAAEKYFDEAKRSSIREAEKEALMDLVQLITHKKTTSLP